MLRSGAEASKVVEGIDEDKITAEIEDLQHKLGDLQSNIDKVLQEVKPNRLFSMLQIVQICDGDLLRGRRGRGEGGRGARARQKSRKCPSSSIPSWRPSVTTSRNGARFFCHFSRESKR